MAYNNTIPQPTDQLKVSQADILANFQAIQTWVLVNHESFNTAGEGKHKFLQMPEQGIDPSTLINEGGLFSIEGTYSATTELAYRRENNGVIIPFTEGVNAENGWSRLASGLLMKWGTFAVAASSNPSQTYTVTFPVGPTFPPFGAAPYQVFMSVGIPNSLIPAPGTTNAELELVYQNLAAVSFDARVITTKVVGSGWPAFSLRYMAIGVE